MQLTKLALILMSYLSAFPTASTTVDGTSDNISWQFSTDILADDGSPALALWDGSADVQTDYMRGRFSLGIPADSTVQGVEVDIEQFRLDVTHAPEDHTVQLVRGSTRVGDNLATSGIWPSSAPVVKTYGGPTNLWGTTWSPSDVNSTNFGVDLKTQIQTTASGASAVDYISMRVHWQTSGTSFITFSPTATLTGTGALSGAATITFSPAGIIHGIGGLSGNSAIVFTPTASIQGTGALSGSASIAFTATGTLTGDGTLSGAATMTFTPSASIHGIGALAGNSTITFTATGTLDAIPEKPNRYTRSPRLLLPGSQQPNLR